MLIRNIYIKTLFKRLFRKKKSRSSKRKNNQVRKTNSSKKDAIRSKRYFHGKT